MITDLFYGLLDITICPNCSKVVTFFELVAPCPRCGVTRFLDDWIDDLGWCQIGCQNDSAVDEILAPCPHCGYKGDAEVWLDGYIGEATLDEVR